MKLMCLLNDLPFKCRPVLAGGDAPLGTEGPFRPNRLCSLTVLQPPDRVARHLFQSPVTAPEILFTLPSAIGKQGSKAPSGSAVLLPLGWEGESAISTSCQASGTGAGHRSGMEWKSRTLHQKLRGAGGGCEQEDV